MVDKIKSFSTENKKKEDSKINTESFVKKGINRYYPKLSKDIFVCVDSIVDRKHFLFDNLFEKNDGLIKKTATKAIYLIYNPLKEISKQLNNYDFESNDISGYIDEILSVYIELKKYEIKVKNSKYISNSRKKQLLLISNQEALDIINKNLERLKKEQEKNSESKKNKKNKKNKKKR